MLEFIQNYGSFVCLGISLVVNVFLALKRKTPLDYKNIKKVVEYLLPLIPKKEQVLKNENQDSEKPVCEDKPSVASPETISISELSTFLEELQNARH
ncbi:MAG: hypothetical protein [Chaetfec virus UA24_2285]|nr:MAG: hypothetical protein [Chaetfec virus UA24_2285]